jgi:hypothetical protein
MLTKFPHIFLSIFTFLGVVFNHLNRKIFSIEIIRKPRVDIDDVINGDQASWNISIVLKPNISEPYKYFGILKIVEPYKWRILHVFQKRYKCFRTFQIQQFFGNVLELCKCFETFQVFDRVCHEKDTLELKNQKLN